MSRVVCVFVAHGFTRENVRLQPWRYLYELAVRYSKLGRVLVITDANPSTEEESWNDNLKVLHSGLLSPKRRYELIEYINETQPERVWWSVTPRSIVYSGSWKKLCCPLVALVTCPLYPWSLLARAWLYGVPTGELRALLLQRLVPRFLFSGLLNMVCVNKVLVQSAANRKILLGSGVGEDKVAVVPVGIDPEDRETVPTEKISETTRGYGFPEGAFICTYMGGIRKIRGIDVLLAAFASTAKRAARTYLVILARGADKETCRRLENQCRTLGLDGRVRVIGGWLSREQVREHIGACDVVTLPFVVVPSDVPIAVLESLARGKPVIGTRVDGIPELVEGRGLSVAAMNESELAKAIETLAESRVEYSRMSEAAGQYMSKYPDWESVFALANDVVQASG